MPRGKSGPKPKTPEEIEATNKAKPEKETAAQAAKEAKAKAAADAKAAKAKAAEDAKAQKEIEKTEKKAQREAAKEAKKNGIGHNSDLTQDEKRALLVNGVGEIIDLQGKMATHSAAI